MGSRTTYTLNREPHRAAVCIARNVDWYSNQLVAHIKPGRDPVLAEVHVSADELLALVQLSIQGEGSTAIIWAKPNAHYQRESLIAAMIAGC